MCVFPKLEGGGGGAGGLNGTAIKKITFFAASLNHGKTVCHRKIYFPVIFLRQFVCHFFYSCPKKVRRQEGVHFQGLAAISQLKVESSCKYFQGGTYKQNVGKP